jgi:hypothetical protein
LYRQLAGNFHAFLDFFFYILVAVIYVAKTEKNCLKFVYISAHSLPVKWQTTFLILLPQSIFFLLSTQCLYNTMEKYTFFCQTIIWQEFKLSIGFLKHIACTLRWKNTPVLPNNCLTRIHYYDKDSDNFSSHFKRTCIHSWPFNEFFTTYCLIIIILNSIASKTTKTWVSSREGPKYLTMFR